MSLPRIKFLPSEFQTERVKEIASSGFRDADYPNFYRAVKMARDVSLPINSIYQVWLQSLSDIILILSKPRLLRRAQLNGVSKGGEHPFGRERGSNPAHDLT